MHGDGRALTVANVTVEGTADELGPVISSVAEKERQQHDEAKRDAEKLRVEEDRRQKELAETIEEDEDMAEQQTFDFGAAFDKMTNTLASKLDELKNPETVKEQRKQSLLAELAELGITVPEPSDDGEEKTKTPPPPTKKTPAPAAGSGGGKTDTDSKSGTEGEPPPKKSRWSWYGN